MGMISTDYSDSLLIAEGLSAETAPLLGRRETRSTKVYGAANQFDKKLLRTLEKWSPHFHQQLELMINYLSTGSGAKYYNELFPLLVPASCVQKERLRDLGQVLSKIELYDTTVMDFFLDTAFVHDLLDARDFYRLVGMSYTSPIRKRVNIALTLYLVHLEPLRRIRELN